MTDQPETAPEPTPSEAPGSRLNLDLVMDVPVSVQVVLGSTTMTVANLLNLGQGATIKLDTRVGEPVDVLVNGRVMARGEIVVLDEDEERFGITLSDVAAPGTRLPPRAREAA